MRPSTLRHPARVAGASLLRLQSDERLAALAVDGHEAAFAAIVDRYRTPLTRYCAGIVGPNRAEDAVQQALINAHDALKRTDEVRHLRSWLYRIAHNAALNVLRTVRDDVSLDAAAAADAAALADGGPAASFERTERFEAVVAALHELPERQRAALVLRELEGRSHEEIAAALGVTPSAARQHIMRGRTAIRGAVTAITPYPLIVRLAELLSSPAAGGWTDAAVGAGATATLAKLTAGIAATTALVGGAVGTERIVHHHAAVERPATKRPPARRATIGLPLGARGGTAPDTNNNSRDDTSGSGAKHSDGAGGKSDRGKSGDVRSDSSGSGSDGSGTSGSSGSGSSDSGSGDNDSSGSSGHGSSGSNGSGSGSSGSSGGSGSSTGSSSSGSGKDGSGSSSGGASGSDSSGSGGATGSSGKSGGGSSGSGSDGSGDDTSSDSSGKSGDDDGSSGLGSASHGGDAANGGDDPAITIPTTTTVTAGSDSSGKGSGKDSADDVTSGGDSDDG